MTNICIGPLCIPIQALVPFLFILFRIGVAWFKTNVLKTLSPEEKALAELPPPPAVVERKWVDPSIVHITDAAHLERVKREAMGAGVPVVIDFTAGWCGPCRSIAPLFEELSQQYDACFVKVDIDEADDVALTYKVRSMPTFVFLRIVGDQIEEVRFSGCNKIKLEGLVKAMCAAVVKGEVRETKEEDKKKK
ncbi:hypothetical protein NSK_008706 [Nannochloropsis salina CCMP1776]|uniref:Thioredoxin domain-containing protein n=1 Tax=Nannochloropsis salina CCMP1776 TaxID=1027361 RepID=A0A4D9CTV6_9STRA|nr:hypothetical protein NSK_008706 [Nannochloropsis salina CCMP1776]|eukprot:TFJ80149.1 hypothetical protein NSK_008706 [Nannochloropsis salina CCMP1776]